MVSKPQQQARHRNFLVQLENFDNESRNAARYVYANFALDHAVSQSTKLQRVVNETATFWLTVRASLQTAAYICLSRIFETKTNFNIQRLLDAAENDVSLFGREALASRKRGGSPTDPPWLQAYLDEAFYPSKKDFAKLRKLADANAALYSRGFKPARHKYIAHREKQDPAQVAALFNRGEVRDLWRLVVFVQQLHDSLWQLLYNGNKPSFRRHRYSVKQMFRKPPTGSSAHEKIVREVQQLTRRLEQSSMPRGVTAGRAGAPRRLR